jgi:hypothetical protein
LRPCSDGRRSSVVVAASLLQLLLQLLLLLLLLLLAAVFVWYLLVASLAPPWPSSTWRREFVGALCYARTREWWAYYLWCNLLYVSDVVVFILLINN